MQTFFFTLLLTAAIVAAPYALLRWLYRRRRPGGGPGREVVLALFVLFMAGLLVLVLQPRAGGAGLSAAQRLATGQGINLVPFYTLRSLWRPGLSTSFLVNIVGNVAMFVPVGLCLPLLYRRWQRLWKVALVALLFPMAIEAAQLFNGRSVDVDDVLLNACGVLLGYGCYRLLRLILPKSAALAL